MTPTWLTLALTYPPSILPSLPNFQSSVAHIGSRRGIGYLPPHTHKAYVRARQSPYFPAAGRARDTTTTVLYTVHTSSWREKAQVSTPRGATNQPRSGSQHLRHQDHRRLASTPAPVAPIPPRLRAMLIACAVKHPPCRVRPSQGREPHTQVCS